MKRLRSLLLFFLPFVIFTYASFILFQKACDFAMNAQAEKPIHFNHKTHVTTYGATDCELCHGYYDNGRFKGMPTVADCKMCHDGNTAKEKALFGPFKDTDKPWTSFARQPDLVYFSHIARHEKHEAGPVRFMSRQQGRLGHDRKDKRENVHGAVHGLPRRAQDQQYMPGVPRLAGMAVITYQIPNEE